MLFTSDEGLRELQRKAVRDAARTTNTRDVSPEEQRREAIEADRELREHQRWRQFAFLLFIAPIIVWLVMAIASWIVWHFALGGTTR